MEQTLFACPLSLPLSGIIKKNIFSALLQLDILGLIFLNLITSIYLLILLKKGGIYMTATAVAVKIDMETRKRLKTLAGTKKRSAHWLMCEAIRQYIEREEKREAFRQEAVSAWEEYQETGLHATGGEVMDWLKTWGTDNEKDTPECHQ